MEFWRDLLSAFSHIQIGWIRNEPAYYRKRLLHKGYQILIKIEIDDNPYVSDILERSYFEFYKNVDTKEEVYREVLAA